MMASISNPATKLISASGAGTLSALAIVHLGLAGLLIGAVVVITVAALAAGDPYPLLTQIHAWRQRRWLLQHAASNDIDIDAAERILRMTPTIFQEVARAPEREA